MSHRIVFYITFAFVCTMLQTGCGDETSSGDAGNMSGDAAHVSSDSGNTDSDAGGIQEDATGLEAMADADENIPDSSIPGLSDGVRILPLGDSITEGVPHHYRYALDQRLTQAGINFDFVGSMKGDAANYGSGWDDDHEGHDGWGTVDIIAELPTWLNGYDADVALIHLGTNDVFAVQAGEFTWAESIANMGSIIGALRSDNSKIVIYLAQITPIYSEQGVEDTAVDEWNRRLAQLAAELATVESPIIVVDMNNGFLPGDFEGDGIHPNEVGGIKMADVWATALLP